MADPEFERGPDGPNDTSSGAVVRRNPAEPDAERHEHDRHATASTAPPPSTASADSVDALRRSVRALKHDVRMLKVVVDKQSVMLEELLGRLQSR